MMNASSKSSKLHSTEAAPEVSHMNSAGASCKMISGSGGSFKVSSVSSKLVAGKSSKCQTRQSSGAIHEYTPRLLAACRDGNLKAVHDLVHDPDTYLNGLDETESNSALHYAVLNNMTEIVTLLLEAGAVVDIQNDLHETPLFIASREGCLDIVQLLLGVGADIDLLNIDGQNAVKVAKTKKIKELLQMVKATSI